MNYTNIIINQLVTFVYIISCKLNFYIENRKPKLYASLFYGIINKRKKRGKPKKKTATF